jgi:hypothetical protein
MIVLEELLKAGELSTAFHGDRDGDRIMLKSIQIKKISSCCLESLVVENLEGVNEKFVYCTISTSFRMYKLVDRSRGEADCQNFIFAVITKALKSTSELVRGIGWILLSRQCELSISTRPPPLAYNVEVLRGNVNTSMDGLYKIVPTLLTDSGRVKNEVDLPYAKEGSVIIIDSSGPRIGKGIILHRKTVDGASKFDWSFSPPCFSGEIELAFTPVGVVVPDGEKSNEQELAIWAIQSHTLDIALQYAKLNENARICAANLLLIIKKLCQDEAILGYDMITNVMVDAQKPSSKSFEQKDGTALRRSTRKRKSIMN